MTGMNDGILTVGISSVNEGMEDPSLNVDESGEPLDDSDLTESQVTVKSPEDEKQGGDIVFLIGSVVIALLLILAAAAVLFKRRNARQMAGKRPKDKSKNMITEKVQEETAFMSVKTIQTGKLHNIGKRGQQQDSFGMTDTKDGIFAVVADGMGGLAGGDKVSQKIVMTMLQDAAVLPASRSTCRLFEMVAHANDVINRMLGMPDQYSSGSTVVAVKAGRDAFEWVSVGDSRIYLYRGGRLIQLNREHTYEEELLWQAVNGEITFEEVQENPRRKGLTSFIGMGRLKYIDGSRRPLPVQPGDRLLLMSDGVFNTLSEQEICDILKDYGDPQRAAAAMEERVLQYQRPKQDNFTTVILAFEG